MFLADSSLDLVLVDRKKIILSELSVGLREMLSGIENK